MGLDSIIHSRPRNMCSSLNADLHLVNLKPSPACICGHGFEDCIHLLTPVHVVFCCFCCELESPSDWVYSIQHYVMKFVSALQQVSSTNKTERHDITEILFKVALNTIIITPNPDGTGNEAVSPNKDQTDEKT